MFALLRDLYNHLLGNNYPSRTALAKLNPKKTTSTQTDTKTARAPPPAKRSPVTTVSVIYPVAEWKNLDAEMF